MLMLVVHSLPAQSTGSVIIYNKSIKGTNEERAITEYLSAKIGGGMLKQYPCVDWIDQQGIATLLENERQRQLLGQDPNDEMLSNLAGALGARYIIALSARTLPNGQAMVSAKVMDSRTLRTLVDKTQMTGGGDDALDKVEVMAQQLLQGLAGIFKNRCDPHWTGTISQTMVIQSGESKETPGIPGAMESKVKVWVTHSDKAEHKIEAVLQPNTLGAQGAKTMARVTNSYDHRYERTLKRTSTIRCRPNNAPSYTRDTNGNSSEIITETGRKTETMPVYIHVYKSTGTFEISVDYPAMTTKRREESRGVKSGCKDESFSESSETPPSPAGEAFGAAGFLKISGNIDPKNPDVLVGQEITGDDKNGKYIRKWNLRMVRPKGQGSKK